MTDAELEQLEKLARAVIAPCECSNGGVWGEINPDSGEPSIRFCRHHWRRVCSVCGQLSLELLADGWCRGCDDDARFARD